VHLRSLQGAEAEGQEARAGEEEVEEGALQGRESQAAGRCDQEQREGLKAEREGREAPRPRREGEREAVLGGRSFKARKAALVGRFTELAVELLRVGGGDFFGVGAFVEAEIPRRFRGRYRRADFAVRFVSHRDLALELRRREDLVR